jgi:hypothetical protein
MMAGGLFMLGFGVIAMLLFIGLPVALIVILVWIQARRRNSCAPVSAPAFLSSTAAARTCSHCGAALQTGWSHCPQCGTPL